MYQQFHPSIKIITVVIITMFCVYQTKSYYYSFDGCRQRGGSFVEVTRTLSIACFDVHEKTFNVIMSCVVELLEKEERMKKTKQK